MARHDCRPTDLTLFPRTVEDLPALVAEQDVVWVWGGSTANLLALWRLHGLDGPLRAAYERGAVLCGISAGMNCWFESCTTDSFGLTLAPLSRRARPAHRLRLPALRRRGAAAPALPAAGRRRRAGARLGGRQRSRAALPGGELVEAVTLRDGAAAYRVEPGSEVRVAARLLE